MATKADMMKARAERLARESGFDVTVTTSIGRVEHGQGDMTPTEAAFRLIAQWGNSGEFTFPMGPDAKDGMCHVEVKYDDVWKDDTEPGALHKQRM